VANKHLLLSGPASPREDIRSLDGVEKHSHRYADIVKWWVQYVKRRIQAPLIWEGKERNTDRVNIENYDYAAMYDLLRDTVYDASKVIALKELKTKIIG